MKKLFILIIFILILLSVKCYAADTKLSNLTGNILATTDDLVYFVDSSGPTSYKLTIASLESVIFSGDINAGEANWLRLPVSATPSTDSLGQLTFDSDAWAAGRGAGQIHDGTATTYILAALASDSPNNGQVPKINSGVITWEDDNNTAAITGTDTRVLFFDGTSPSEDANFTFNKTTNIVTADGFQTTAVNDPQIDFDPVQASDTSWSIGVNTEGGNDNDDRIEIRQGTTAGAGVQAFMDVTGDLVINSGRLNSCSSIQTDAYGRLSCGSAGNAAVTFDTVIPIHSMKLPSVNAAQIDASGARWALLFSASAQNIASYDTVLAPYNGGSLTATVKYSMASATSGNLKIDVRVMCIGTTEDVDVESYGARNSVTQTVPGTAGFEKDMIISLSDIDSCGAGKHLVFALQRDPYIASNATGNAEIRSFRVSE